MKQPKILAIWLIIILAAVAFYMGHKKNKRIYEHTHEPTYGYILKTNLEVQKVNYLFPFSAASSQKTIFVDASQAEDVQKIAPVSIAYLVRRKTDDYVACTSRGKTYPIVLGDGEISFWPQFEGLTPPAEIDLENVLAFSWTEKNIEKAKTNPMITDTLKKLEISTATNNETEENSPPPPPVKQPTPVRDFPHRHR